MVIYAEYLFAENFITGGIILILTGKIAGVKIRKSLLIMGSILCGLYAFILFWEGLRPWCAILLKLLFSLGITAMVFPVKSVKQMLKRWMIFYLVSFALGGITIGAAYFTGYHGVTQNASVYLQEISYFNILSGCLLSYILLSAFARFIKGRLMWERTRTHVHIEMDRKTVRLKGLVDTGNHLRDPFTGRPVLVVSLEAMAGLLSREIMEIIRQQEAVEVIYEQLMKTDAAGRIRLIPYQSIGKSRGLLIGIRPDRLTIENPGDGEHGRSMPEDVILAIYKEGFKRENQEEGYSILLHPSAMEGGIACHV